MRPWYYSNAASKPLSSDKYLSTAGPAASCNVHAQWIVKTDFFLMFWYFTILMFVTGSSRLFFFCNCVNTCSWSFASMCRRASKFSRKSNTFFGHRTVFCRDNIHHDRMLCLIHTHTARIPSFDSLNDFCFGHACWLRQVVALFRKINGQSLELGCWNGQ